MKIKTCPDCNGDGVVDKDTDNERQCPTCGGLGFVPDDDDGHEEVIKTTTIACKLRCDRARGGPQPQGPCLYGFIAVVSAAPHAFALIEPPP